MKKHILKLTLALVVLLITAQVQAGPQEDLSKACQSGNLDAVKKAIADGAQVNTLDVAGNPAITYAFFWPDIVKYLLENKADPNLGSTTVLFQASFYSSLDVLKLILDAGADPNKPMVVDASVTFKTMLASEKAKGKDANKYLIKAYEDGIKNAKPIENYPLPSVITNTNCVPCLQLLLDKGAKINLGITDGTLIHTFAAGGASKEYRKTTNAAIKKSIEPYGYTVPDWYLNMPADRMGEPEEILKLLLGKGLAINEKNAGVKGGIPAQTPLETALGAGLGNKKEVMLALIANGSDVKITSDWYGPEIFQAAQTGFTEVVKAMVEKGADINTEGTFFGQTEGASLKGYTPLIIAAYEDNLDMVKYLIGAGAKTDAGVEGRFFNPKTSCLTKVSDKTAIYYAIENGNVPMVKFMVDADVKWWKHLKIHQIKERSISQGINGLGQAVTIYTTECFDAGEYLPSMYVNAVAGNKKINAKNKMDDKPGMSQEQKDGLKDLIASMKAKGI